MPEYSCPSCGNEIEELAPPNCDDCGAGPDEYPQAVDWIECPSCSDREVQISASKKTGVQFEANCQQCEYSTKIGWSDQNS